MIVTKKSHIEGPKLLPTIDISNPYAFKCKFSMINLVNKIIFLKSMEYFQKSLFRLWKNLLS